MNELTTRGFAFCITFCIRTKASFKWGQRSKFWVFRPLHPLFVYASSEDWRDRVEPSLKSTLIYRTVLKSPWKLNLIWKVLEKHSKVWKSPWILPFTEGFNTVFGELNQHKIVMPLFSAGICCTKIKAPQFYTDFLKFISLVMQSSISMCIYINIFHKFSVLENSRKVF